MQVIVGAAGGAGHDCIDVSLDVCGVSSPFHGFDVHQYLSHHR